MSMSKIVLAAFTAAVLFSGVLLFAPFLSMELRAHALVAQYNKQPKTGITKRRCRITSRKITILRGGTHEELDRNSFSRGFGRHFGRPGSGRERSRMGIPDSRHGRQ